MTRFGMLRVLTATAVATATLGVLSSPAQALVDQCVAWKLGGNEAAAYCKAGFGRYRVAAKCDSPTYPYSITVYGPWKWRETTTKEAPRSYVDGDRYGCHIVRVWTSV
ncbi:hypothetical protein [Nonomuraea ceibae]|uniref:hypothetical protein n=1 Tax=Nonomuraea ceibae TaxID=1935170 RepID=UPI001C5E1627|nr:hypothetical protein [Nonomuraea ceibae]